MLGGAEVSASVGHRGGDHAAEHPSALNGDVALIRSVAGGEVIPGGWFGFEGGVAHSTFPPSRTRRRNMLCKRGQHGM
jgi:hypothetical protein